jgi:hypothetical protein
LLHKKDKVKEIRKEINLVRLNLQRIEMSGALNTVMMLSSLRKSGKQFLKRLKLSKLINLSLELILIFDYRQRVYLEKDLGDL